MAEQYAIAALKRKRAELAGEILRADNRKAAAKAEIQHIDAVLRIMGYDKDPSLIQPRMKYKRIFGRGELKRMILDIMRQSSRPLSNREIGVEVIRRKGWDDTEKLRLMMVTRVRASRRYIPRDGANCR